MPTAEEEWSYEDYDVWVKREFSEFRYEIDFCGGWYNCSALRKEPLWNGGGEQWINDYSDYSEWVKLGFMGLRFAMLKSKDYNCSALRDEPLWNVGQ